MRKYVERRDGGYYLVGSRVSLESVIYEFLDGASPETIVDNYPTLSLEQVYGAITFYLANRSELNGYLARLKNCGKKPARTASAFLLACGNVWSAPRVGQTLNHHENLISGREA